MPKKKLYYNINIVGKPKDGEFESEAKFNVILNQTLIANADKY